MNENYRQTLQFRICKFDTTEQLHIQSKRGKRATDRKMWLDDPATKERGVLRQLLCMRDDNTAALHSSLMLFDLLDDPGFKRPRNRYLGDRLFGNIKLFDAIIRDCEKRTTRPSTTEQLVESTLILFDVADSRFATAKELPNDIKSALDLAAKLSQFLEDTFEKLRTPAIREEIIQTATAPLLLVNMDKSEFEPATIRITRRVGHFCLFEHSEAPSGSINRDPIVRKLTDVPFFATEDSAPWADCLFSVLATCRERGVEPSEFLLDTLQQMKDGQPPLPIPPPLN